MAWVNREQDLLVESIWNVPVREIHTPKRPGYSRYLHMARK